MDQDGSRGDFRGRTALSRTVGGTGKRAGSVAAFLRRPAACRAGPGDAIWSRMCLGATPAAAVRSQGLQKYMGTGCVDYGFVEANRGVTRGARKRDCTRMCLGAMLADAVHSQGRVALAGAVLRRDARVTKQDN